MGPRVSGDQDVSKIANANDAEKVISTWWERQILYRGQIGVCGSGNDEFVDLGKFRTKLCD